MSKGEKTAKELLAFIDASPSRYHVIHNLVQMLKGFEPLLETEKWKIEPGKSYYVVRNDSSLIAFRVPKQDYTGVYIAASHSDSPTFKVKTNAQMKLEGQYTRLNTEKYGGMLMAPWFDRMLSVAGRVVVKEDGKFVSKLVDIDRDLLLIPSVAIHMNRNSNDGQKYDAQVDTIPLFGGNVKENCFMKMIAEAAGIKVEEILGSDLYLYLREQGKIWGAEKEFISARALDDLQCAYATMKGFVNSKKTNDKLAVCCVFDNEEVGSLTGQGADSTFLADVLQRINESLGFSPTVLKQAIGNGFMISADNAHAVHPNHPEYADPTNRPYLNKGIVIKYNAAQKYTTDAMSEAMFRDICKRCDIPVQTYTNKSNVPGGSTLGNISNRHISIRTVDLGLPQLAMHSAYETAGVEDTEYLVKAAKEFFS